MRSLGVNTSLYPSPYICLALGLGLVSSQANAMEITITRQDLGFISGSVPAYQYDCARNLLGTIGPQGNSSFIQDIVFDDASGDLWALITDANTSVATLNNLTQNTSFATGFSVGYDRGANIALFSPSQGAAPEPATIALFGSAWPASVSSGAGSHGGRKPFARG